MQSSSTVRSVLAYSLVALVLGAAIFGGLWVTKNRNSTVAATPQKPAVTQPKTDTNKQPAQQQTPSASKPDTTPKTSPAAPKPTPTTTPSTTPSTPPKQNPVAVTPAPKTSTPKTSAPSRVPATGTEDTLVATAALMGLVFAGFMYAQSRRRLLALR